jgi:TnpA family transposase
VHWTLAGTDHEAIHRRRRARNRLGFALQLCALRYPGRLLGRELIPAEALRSFASSPLTRGLLPAQATALDALLTTKESASISGLAWTRQLMRDLALSRCHSGGYQLIDNEWTGHNQRA